ncbi:MAG: MBL fold metallo-hydrolase [bacterium]|nr:MBL fold metallo-hydrolase [bacterium]
MLYLKSFTFNPFQENTYVVYDDDSTAFIFDPGNSNPGEDAELKKFIEDKKLNLKRLLLTHGHVDHVMGNRFIYNSYGLLPEVHKDDLFFVERMAQSASMYGVSCEQSPLPEKYLEDGQKISLGNYLFECIHTPGHSPGSISFYCPESKLLIGGDVLFNGSIGRSDLPMGNHETLIHSIKERLMVLGGDIKVYSGHGPATTTGFESENNPFLT